MSTKFKSRDRTSLAKESARVFKDLERVFKDLEMKHKEKNEKEDRSISISSSSGSKADHNLEDWMICTSCWQLDSKLTCLKPRPLSSSIAQTRHSASACSGEFECLQLL